jgi:hypothetical protein
MFRALLTLCYSATALLGPGACCCSLQTFLNLCPSIAHAADAPPPVKRSCCAAEHSEPAPAGKADGKQPTDSDCPCKKTQDAHLPAHPPSESGVEVVGQHHAFGFVLFDGLTPFASHILPETDASPSVHDRPGGALGGRSLLAALHILRC